MSKRGNKVHGRRDFVKDDLADLLTLCGLDARGLRVARHGDYAAISCGRCQQVIDQANHENKATMAHEDVVAEIERLAKKNRVIKVQPYTFNRWVDMLKRSK